MEQSKAEHKFLNLPELIERLISSLDPLSALRLLESHVIDKDILQKSLSGKAWNKLIRSSSYGEEALLEVEDVKILKLMKVEEPNKFLLTVLDLICESGPSQPYSSGVEVICPNHPEPHLVTPDAFLLLEEVEGAFGTAEQSIESILAYDTYPKNKNMMVPAFPEPFLLATSSRMSRQKEVVDCVCINGEIWIQNEVSAQAFTTLLQAQDVKLKFANLKVGGAVGEEGWKEVASTLHGRARQYSTVSISKEALAAGRREDIEVVGKFGNWNLEVFNTKKEKLSVARDHAWDRLKMFSDMTEDEFTAECRRWRREKEVHLYLSPDEDGYDEDESEGEEQQGEEEDD